MFSKTAALVLVSFIVAQGVRSQVTTASVFPIVDGGAATLQGEVVGTGADGTTYILSGTPTEGSPFTLTLVEDASGVSEHAVAPTGSATLDYNVECGFDSASLGVCTAIIAAGTGAEAVSTTRTDSGTVTLIPVAVSTGSGSAATTTSGSGRSTITSPSSNPSSSPSATQSASWATRNVIIDLGTVLSVIIGIALNA
ncbi:hypothetical protein DFH11DRAFT_1570226 [Phellopilus nigrolimitatus]|nr:hypothetical protein DFH11DRAFT_1570226 [Phellopilus nigrolimitatus]